MSLVEATAILGNLGELIGAVAVVITLVYLAMQIKQNTNAIRASNQATVLINIQNLSQPIIRDRELGAIVVKALAAPELLQANEKLAAYAWFFDMLKTEELTYGRYLAGELDAEYWQATLNFYRSYWSTPGFASDWSDRRGAFTATFQTAIDRWMKEPLPAISRADQLFAAGQGRPPGV